MLKKIIVIDLGSLFDFNPTVLSIFEKIRGVSAKKAQDLVQEFQKNQITQDDFTARLNPLFSSYTPHELGEKWAKMRELSPENQEMLESLDTLSREDQPIYYFWHVDSLQRRSIKELKNCYYSCDRKTPDSCNDFIQTLQERHRGISITVTVFSCQPTKNGMLKRLRVPLVEPTLNPIRDVLEGIQKQQLAEWQALGCTLLCSENSSELYSKVVEKTQELTPIETVERKTKLWAFSELRESAAESRQDQKSLDDTLKKKTKIRVH